MYRNFLIGISLFLSFLIIFFIVRELIVTRNTNFFQNHLHIIDRLNPQEQNLEDPIRNAIAFARTPSEFLTLLAVVDEIEKDLHAIAEEILRRAVKRHPRNDEIRTLFVNYLITENQIFEALSEARRIRSTKYQGLYTEARLRAGLSLLPQDGYALPLSPEEFADPEAMIRAGLASSDDRYYLNAVVMYAAIGKMDAALAIFEAQESLFDLRPEVYLQLLLDLGAYESLDVAQLPEELSREALHSLADLYFYQGAIAESYRVHQDLVNQEQDDSIALHSYQNLLSLIRAHGYEKGDPLEKTLEFKNEEVLVHALAVDDGPIEDTVIELWQILNSDPENIFARNLLLYFLSIRNDLTGLQVALNTKNYLAQTNFIDKRSRQDLEVQQSIENFFRGYLAESLGNRELAKSYFLDLANGYRKRTGFQSAFNLGLIALDEHRFSEAFAWFVQAREEIALATGSTATQVNTLYSEEFLRTILYEGISASLLQNLDAAQERLAFLQNYEYYHPLFSWLQRQIY